MPITVLVRVKRRRIPQISREPKTKIRPLSEALYIWNIPRACYLNLEIQSLPVQQSRCEGWCRREMDALSRWVNSSRGREINVRWIHIFGEKRWTAIYFHFSGGNGISELSLYFSRGPRTARFPFLCIDLWQ